MRTRNRLLAATVLAAALTSLDQAPTMAASGPEPLTAAGLVAALADAGVSVPNPIDTTTQECPAVGCEQVIVTDTMRVTSFPGFARARWYAARRGLPAFGNIVVQFAPPLSAATRHRYLDVIDRMLP